MTANREGKSLTYAQSGVDIHAGDDMVGRIEHHVRRTYTPRVLGDFGSFAGCFRLDFNEKLFKRNYRDPVLVSSTDGVGSKVKIAAQLKIYDTVGQDCVAMNVNDLICQGAEPLFFLDYLAVHKLEPAVAEQLVKGVADGCVLAGCALLGGETAEMPDLYAPGDFDLAGFTVGVCELKRMITGARAEIGDVVIGIPSSGIHSNGYSLVRAIVKHAGLDLDKSYTELKSDVPLGRVLLEPTRIYAKQIVSVVRKYRVKKIVAGMAHITGSGLPGNLPRAFASDLNAKLNRKSWDVPPVFGFLQSHGNVSDAEMFDVFNMGIGFTLIVRPAFADSIVEHLRKQGEAARVIGKMVRGTGQVVLA
ncbi:MAG: phosphoribosylformylglycinamidine cyclo-ligase [Phycisphaeraceae bacterium]